MNTSAKGKALSKTKARNIMELQITMTKTNFELKEGTKTVFVETGKEVSVIDETTHKNIVEAAPFMRRLGGSETLTKCYTCAGYVVYKVVSKNPDRDVKTVRTFDFKYV